jgi:phage terminase small subunit
MNKKPPELHLIDGTRPRGKSTKNVASIPNNIKKRIPRAEWLDDPTTWDKDKFIQETAEFLHEVYGIGSDQDKHTLSMLAGYVDKYVFCEIGIKKTGLVMKLNNGASIGPSPFVSLQMKVTTLIIQLMNELGLTPRGRLSLNKSGDQGDASKFMRGPKG